MPMMTYFRIQLASHGMKSLAPLETAVPLVAYTARPRHRHDAEGGGSQRQAPFAARQRTGARGGRAVAKAQLKERCPRCRRCWGAMLPGGARPGCSRAAPSVLRSEEHTSE